MEKQDALELANSCIKELTEELKQGAPETLTKYLDAMARFHRYSLKNVLMIMKQCPTASYVAGYKAWKDFGRWVKPGEKGIAIVAPVIGKKEKKGDQRHAAKEEESILNAFRVVHVFDIQQTDGADLPKLSEVSSDPGVALELLSDVLGSLGIQLKYDELPHGVLGATTGGTVTVAAGMDAGQQFQVMAHEFAHELMHFQANAEKLSRRVEEVEAEAVAYVVCRAYGVDAKEQTNEYIRLYRGDAKLVEASLQRIRSTATHILFLMSEAEEARRFTMEAQGMVHDAEFSSQVLSIH